MIVVDSSVWIDYFNGVQSDETSLLDNVLGVSDVGVGDLMLVEVLQGFRRDDEYAIAASRLQALTILPMVGLEIALLSAQNFRVLRRRGVTIGKTIDVIIASYCIRHGHPLLFSDRDFEPFVEHLGLLRPAL